MTTARSGPIHGSYWVIPERLLAGPHPGDELEILKQAGLDCFVDLSGHQSYKAELGAAEYHPAPIENFGVPRAAEMAGTIDFIEGALARGRQVYLHCLGGIGRTGTVVACLLKRGGNTADQAFALLAEWRGDHHAPETQQQRDFVRTWDEDK